jgi:predicted nucleic acid-binding protein
MKACFGDTSYFLAMLVPRDVNHQAARRWAAQARTAIVTSEYVVLEVGNFLSPTSTRNLFDGFLRVLRADSRITIVPASSDLMRRGSELYIARTDKSWSLTDCISFEIMRQHGITDALTADRHFEQAGFTVLVKPVT